MAYLIEGIAPSTYAPLFKMTEAELERIGARRVTATAKPGFPCRTSLVDAEPGESLILVNHVSNDVSGPFRSAFAIYLRERVTTPASYRDTLPPVFAGRTISLRGFDADGNLIGAVLATADDANVKIAALFENADIEVINAHNAAAGCFAARIVRS